MLPIRPTAATLLLVLSLSACSDGSSGPDLDDEGARIARQFDALADSVASHGHDPSADALRHAADLVRLTGGATPVTLTIDGQSRAFLAVAEQLDYPLVVCPAAGDSGAGGQGGAEPGRGADPDDGQCNESGTHSMRTLIAWEPERMAEVVRIVADVGSSSAREDVPDVMTGLPFYGADSAGGGVPVSWPGFSGEYMVRDVGSWWVRSGTQSNTLEQEGGACTESRTTFGWAELSCGRATFRFEFAMEVEAPYWEYAETGERSRSEATGEHQVTLASIPVSGVRLEVLAWTPPEPTPLPPETPVDTVTALRLDTSFEASRDGEDVVLRFRVANPTEEPVTFEFGSGQRYDFAALAPSGETLWFWSADKAFVAVVGQVTLAPGEAMEFEERWSPGGVTGPVVLTAALTSSNLPVSRTIRLEV